MKNLLALFSEVRITKLRNSKRNLKTYDLSEMAILLFVLMMGINQKFGLSLLKQAHNNFIHRTGEHAHSFDVIPASCYAQSWQATPRPPRISFAACSALCASQPANSADSACPKLRLAQASLLIRDD
jgi:hypothetical protein